MLKISPFHKITKVVVDLAFVLGALICLIVPYQINTSPVIWASESIKNGTIVIILLSGIIALFVIWELRKILNGVVIGNPFKEEIVDSLRKISLASLALSIIYAIYTMIFIQLWPLIICVIFSVITLVLLTLKDVFKQAVLYKEEIDWTV